MESKVKRIAGELLIFHIVHQKYECTWMRCRFMLHLFVFYNCWTQSLLKKKARGLYLSRQDRKLWRIKELWVCFVSVCVGGLGFVVLQRPLRISDWNSPPSARKFTHFPVKKPITLAYITHLPFSPPPPPTSATSWEQQGAEEGWKTRGC